MDIAVPIVFLHKWFETAPLAGVFTVYCYA